ncbi:hypothetical protein MLD38_017060 [Melastoma candidum]|uniref:Uncharacterized protein n=1 Tax=Melastoma candidum TaxID=119954 RepID=A0ACB9QPZ1_9MYRT|nr:hypothetical protein MLD38_017060 [Melastoma candidum]
MGYGIPDLGNSTELGEIGGGNRFVGLELGGRFSRSEALPFCQWDNPLVPVMEIPSSSRRARIPTIGAQVASCLVDGCNSDLSKCRDYHRRHKVCEMHSKTPTVTIRGQEQRFCQQCSRFHSLSEFDDGKRSCRKRLDGHNRRRRKPQPDPLSLTAGCFFSGFQGGRFTPFSSSSLFAASSLGDCSWPGGVISENDLFHYGGNHHPQQLLKFGSQSALFPGSAFHDVRSQLQYSPAPGFNNTGEFMSAHPLLDSSRSSPPSGANRVSASGRALSLLSPLSAETPMKLSGHHAMQPEPSLSTQSWMGPGFQHNRTAAMKPAIPMLGLECSMDTKAIHHQGMYQHHHQDNQGVEISSTSQSPTPPHLWWE